LVNEVASILNMTHLDSIALVHLYPTTVFVYTVMKLMMLLLLASVRSRSNAMP